jgi:hypothetical protein
MNSRRVLLPLGFGFIVLSISLFTAIFAPEKTFEGSGGRGWGFIYIGLREYVGSFAARYFVMLPLLLIGVLSIRDAWLANHERIDS